MKPTFLFIWSSKVVICEEVMVRVIGSQTPCHVVPATDGTRRSRSAAWARGVRTVKGMSRAPMAAAPAWKIRVRLMGGDLDQTVETNRNFHLFSKRRPQWQVFSDGLR